MFDAPYSFQKIAECKTLLADPVKKLHYKFAAKHRRYFVTIEIFSFNLAVIKYCDVKDKDARHAYKKIFNDGDAFKVITTCLYIMLDHWKKYPTTSFAFYAVPRGLSASLINNLSLAAEEREKFISRYKNIRFNIYQYAMVNLFPPKYFTQLRDPVNSLYLLLNNEVRKLKIFLKHLEAYLLKQHDIIFEPVGSDPSL